MSEGEVATLRREIRELSEKSDRQHADNQKSQERDRETFRTALQTQQQTFQATMDSQRNAFQEALNKQFMMHNALDKTVERHELLIGSALGEGNPGEGRIGILELSMETMKKFRWQALTIVALIMWVAEMLRHGR
jgi:hypothetical protein